MNFLGDASMQTSEWILNLEPSVFLDLDDRQTGRQKVPYLAFQHSAHILG